MIRPKEISNIVEVVDNDYTFLDKADRKSDEKALLQSTNTPKITLEKDEDFKVNEKESLEPKVNDHKDQEKDLDDKNQQQTS